MTVVGEQQDLLDRLENLPFSKFHVILALLVFMAIAFDNMDQVTLSFVIPQYSREWGLTPAITRIHPVLGIGGTLIGAVLGGYLADRIGRRKTFNIMLLVFSATELANGFAQSFLWVIIACFIMGIGVGGAVPIAFSIISEFMPSKRRGIMQILIGVVSIGAGYIIASSAAYAIMPILGWRFLFTIGVIPAFFIPLMQKYCPESPRYFISKGRFDDAIKSVRKVETISGAGHIVNLVIPPRSEIKEENTGGLKELWKKRYRIKSELIWIYGGLWGFFNFSILVWLPTVLVTRLGFTPSGAALYTSIVDFVAIPLGFLTAFLFEKVGRRPTLTVYPIVGGVTTVFIGWFGAIGRLEPVLFIMLGTIIYATGFSLAGMFPAYASELYATSIRASGTGWGVSLSRITGIIGLAILGGLLAAGIGVLSLFILLGVPLVIAGILMGLIGIETKQKKLEEIA